MLDEYICEKKEMKDPRTSALHGLYKSVWIVPCIRHLPYIIARTVVCSLRKSSKSFHICWNLLPYFMVRPNSGDRSGRDRSISPRVAPPSRHIAKAEKYRQIFASLMGMFWSGNVCLIANGAIYLSSYTKCSYACICL